jgi:MFS family permease
MSPLVRRYAIYVLALLTLINFFNYVDRMVLVSMYGDLREQLHLDDWQIGLISGSLFITHAIATVPFGWAADHHDRRKIIAVAVVAWSLATLGSAFAVGFLSLLFFRSFVGIGEAAYGPVANAVIAESFPIRKKALVIAIFNGGMFSGSCMGIYLGARLGFPNSFLWVAVPGLLLGVQAWFLRIPPTRDVHAPRVPYPGTWKMLREAYRSIDIPTLRWMLLSGIFISFAVGGYIGWFVDFVEIEKGVNRVDASNTFGIIVLSGGVTGVVTGGRVADWLQARRPDGRLLTIAIGFLASTPFGVAAIYLPVGMPFYVCSWLMMFFVPWYNGPMAAVIDDVVDDHKSSSAQASFSFFLHLLGTGPGTFAVGLLSSWVGLTNAMLLPVATTVISALLVFPAARHVAADMRAREQRNAEMLAAELAAERRAAAAPVL